MRSIQIVSLILSGLILAHPVAAAELTIERLVASPSLDGPSTGSVKFSPDGKRVTFLQGKADNFEQQDLWEYNIADRERRLLVDSKSLLPGEEELSEVERARRERQRIYASGIIEYFWAPDSDALLFPLGGDIYYLPLGGEARRLTETGTFETDIKFSPKGRFVSFIRERDLYVIELSSGKETRLTTDGGGVIGNGVAEFAAQEEMDRNTGYWWAPDESRIAYARIDESPVKVFDRYELAAAGVKVVKQRYPYAGTSNVLIRLGVIAVSGGPTAWMDLGGETDIYLARVDWLPGSKTLAIQRQSRDQKRLDLIFADASRGAAVSVLTETSETWLNLSHDLYFLDGSEQFLWTSERSGYRHIYLYGNDGTLVRQVTSGDWVVSGIEDYDEAEGVVYFHGLYDTPLERHLYKVSYKESGADIIRLTAEAGWHDTVTNLGSGFVDSYSASDVPPRIALKNMAGELITYIQENPLDESHPYYPYMNTHARAIFGTLSAADGTDLHYRLIRQAGFDCEARHPLIVFVYGGPGVQQVRNRWLLDFNQILARNGYVVLTVDNRGSINRGTAFEGVLYRSMGETEVLDQVAGVNFFTGIGMIDPARVGIWGWSYGGYMTLMSLSKAGEVFKAGVSVAPVTDWRLYDTHYTERYLGDPNAPGGVYEESSVFKHLDGLTGSLLVMHGMADDNVVFDHTVKLIDELQNRRKTFQMMTYPGKRHRISGEDTRAHVWRTALDFFNKELKSE